MCEIHDDAKSAAGAPRETGLSATKNRDAWLLARYDSVTCTDLGKVMGLDRTSRRMLLLSKLEHRDVMENAPEQTKYIMSMGRVFETNALQAFLTAWQTHLAKSSTPDCGYVPSMSVHPDHVWFTGTADYVIPDSHVTVELKTHWYETMETAKPIAEAAAIPLRYYLQLQGYLEIYNYDTGYLVSWTLLNGHAIYKVRRDRDLMHKLVIPEAYQFYTWYDRIKNSGMNYSSECAKCATFKRGEKESLICAVYDSMIINTALCYQRDAETTVLC